MRFYACEQFYDDTIFCYENKQRHSSPLQTCSLNALCLPLPLPLSLNDNDVSKLDDITCRGRLILEGTILFQ
jgi:hypothetical protein